MAEKANFQRQQFDFAAHIRDPQTHAAPAGIEDRRMAVYRSLFYNNVESLLAQSFPVLRKILPDADWHALVRDYFSTHRAKTPYFLEVPQELLLYLQNERGTRAGDHPFLLELAHYEWAELAVSVLEVDEAAFAGVDPNGDLLDGVPVINPAAWSLSYRYEVHKIGPGYLPTAPAEQPTYLVVYRRRDDSVGFLEINAVTARLLELVGGDEERTGRTVLEQIAAELQHPKPATVVAGGRDTFNNLREQQIVLGAHKPKSGGS